MNKDTAINLLKAEIEQERKFSWPGLDTEFLTGKFKVLNIILDSLGIPQDREWYTLTYSSIIELYYEDAIKEFVDECFETAQGCSTGFWTKTIEGREFVCEDYEYRSPSDVER